MQQVFNAILLNISVLVLIAHIITRLPFAHYFTDAENYSLASKMKLGLMFSSVGILSTYIGLSVDGVIANTRVIGVLTGGILGGPVVGLIAGLVAGAHRFAIDVGGLSTTACSLATLVEGLIGGMFSHKIRQDPGRMWKIGLLAAFCQMLEMGFVLILSRPFSHALALVKIIAPPMILFNAVGTIIFIGVFDSIFLEQDKLAAKRVRLVLQIADQCLPHFQKGLYSAVDMNAASDIILKQTGLDGVAITDKVSILGQAGQILTNRFSDDSLHAIVHQTIESGQARITPWSDRHHLEKAKRSKAMIICAPLTQKDGLVVGTLMLLLSKQKLSMDVELWFAKGLAQLLSTQAELSQLEIQKQMRRKAEIMALQSQINPHFLFNALSTISMFCREKPQRARELLLDLSQYFRNTLQTQDEMIRLQQEMQHVQAYLELEKARFGPKLQIMEDIPSDIDCKVPPFILQPLVENAIKHGAMKVGKGCSIQIQAIDDVTGIHISVTDNGPGIPDIVIRKLYHDKMDKESVGLSNVHKRLKSIYGEEYGLTFANTNGENVVVVHIPK